MRRDSRISVRSAIDKSENRIAKLQPSVVESEGIEHLFHLAAHSLIDFIKFHSLPIKGGSEAFARAIAEGRCKMGKLPKKVKRKLKKLKRKLKKATKKTRPLLMAIAAKFIILIPVFLGALIFLMFGGVIVSGIAFVVMSIIGFNSFVRGRLTGPLRLAGIDSAVEWQPDLQSPGAEGGNLDPYTQNSNNS